MFHTNFQNDALKRLEKEKGRKLTKLEMSTTMRALVMYNSKKRKSLKKKKNKEAAQENGGEGVEGEDDKQMEEDEFEDDDFDEDDEKRIRLGNKALES